MTEAVFLDLREAFDMVDHGRILSKLPIYVKKANRFVGSRVVYSTESIWCHLLEPLLRKSSNLMWCTARLNISPIAIYIINNDIIQNQNSLGEVHHNLIPAVLSYHHIPNEMQHLIRSL